MCKEPVNCCCLFNHVILQANNEFIMLCDSIEGTIGSFIIDPNHEQNINDMSIDILLNMIKPLQVEEEESEKERNESHENLQEE
jgi:hypothetical protein